MLRIVGLVLAVLVVVLGASFAWLNAGAVRLDLWVGEYELGLPFVLFVVLLTGWVLGMLSMVGIIVRQVREIRRLRRNVKLAETEINNLRSIPIRNAH
jgi:lipopolysaccharide assembly protein A